MVPWNALSLDRASTAGIPVSHATIEGSVRASRIAANELPLIPASVLVLPQLALEAMLCEVYCNPSPGLVSARGTGAHRDMDWFKFIGSSVCIQGYLGLVCELVYRQAGSGSLPNLEELRAIGLEAERAMLRRTGGVNTQKGLIYFFILVLAAAAYLEGQGTTPTTATICRVVSEVAVSFEQDVQRTELPTWRKSAWVEHRLGGARDEAANGLVTVRLLGLPALEACLADGLSLNDSLVHTLIVLISEVDDTCIVHRAGIQGLQRAQSEARHVLGLGGSRTAEGRAAIVRMDAMFCADGMSPGGSADLLAVTTFFWLLAGSQIQASRHDAKAPAAAE